MLQKSSLSAALTCLTWKILQLHPVSVLSVHMCSDIYVGYPHIHTRTHVRNSVSLACLSIIRFRTAWFIQSWNVFRLNLKRTDTLTTGQKKEYRTKELREKRGRWNEKIKNGSVLVGLRFEWQSRPMNVSVDKGGDEGGTERKIQREWLRERGSRKRNTAQNEEDSRTNSASIVRVAWLTF